MSGEVRCKGNGELYAEDKKFTEKLFTENEKSVTVHQPHSLEQDKRISLVTEQCKKEIVVA